SYGNLSYTRKADITVSVEGTYENLYFEEGDAVSAGAVVARLSNIQLNIQLSQAQAAITSAQAGVELAQARYEEGRSQVEARLLGLEKSLIEIEQKRREVEELNRAQSDQTTLFDVGGITEATLRAAQLSYLSADTDLQALEKDLEIRRIGLRDRDILAAGLATPDSPEAKRELLADLNTRTLRAELDVARARLTSARTEYESVLALADELVIRSPISGIIGVRGPEAGEKASQGDSIYTVFEDGDVHVVFPIQESDAVSVSRGLEVRVTVDAFPGDEFEARIERVSPVVDPQSGNVTVRALIKDAGIRLQPGMFARVSVKTDSPRNAVLVPETVLVEKRGNQAEVFTVRNGKAFSKSIVLGRQYGDRFEVIQNLGDGELLIDEPSPILREGEAVLYES
ncbi:MAG: efflux RND transporter periplasmic adaptor subunit, partial [Spirochaetaceae bacterium]|nr:efflux RND transporter periplasmic adaptor subunit [Spirochaetaceae bacterium]